MNQRSKSKQKSKVLVEMSGGVDSSVAAALLKKQGCNVVGVFMKLNDFSSASEERAKKVAKILKIPFKVFDFKKEFKKRIVDYFLKGYKEGITPNPCVACNKEIKFGLLIKKALALGANYIATGHYARIRESKNGIDLLKGKDRNKDQSYFLWKLSQSELKHILFPIGSYTRSEVEKMAEDFKLPFLNVKKSVEVCFVPKTIEGFLKKYFKLKTGQIIDGQGKILGKHEGLPLYTIGQRKRIGLPGGPYYVLGKDFKKNLLIVTKNEKDLYKKELMVKNVNWISGKAPGFPFKANVKIRYRSKSASAMIYKLDAKRYTLIFTKPQRAITPGQSAVFYLPVRRGLRSRSYFGEGGSYKAKEVKKEELLGGGVIC